MDVSLSRVDYAQIGTTSKGCLRVLTAVTEKSATSSDNNQTDRIVVGSHNGSLLCFSRKNADTQIIFKTLPSARINCVQIGGALGTIQDKIFVSTGNAIAGFSKKGKQFFTFETNMTESVASMYIYGVDMLLCGKNTLIHYHDCIDTNSYLSSDQINDVICLPITEGAWVGRGLTPILACDDRSIKVIDGSVLAYQVTTTGIPNILHLYMNNGGRMGQLLLFGTKDGHLGLVDLPQKGGRLLWEEQTKSTAAITTIDCYSILGTDQKDIIIGKDDGAIEIYACIDDRIVFRQSYQCDESITGMQCGRVNSSNFDEIVVCTYTGWVFGVTTERLQKEIGHDQRAFPLSAQMEIKVQQLKLEIEQLESHVNEERNKYFELTAKEGAESGLSTVPLFGINDRFVLNRDDAAYVLSIELAIPIDYVLLQCDVAIDLLDVETNSAVVSVTPCEQNSPNAILATYRCQANTTRLELKIRSIEGQYGTLLCYIAPKTHPKTCQVRSYAIKPLSLHQRIHEFDTSRPSNILKLSGQFTMAEAHSWLMFCLPEMPEKVPPTDTARFCFSSVFNGGTQLECTYTKGNATFRSDNLSTIAILRDVLGKEATKKKIKVDISTDINDESIAHTLQLLHPKLEYQMNLTRKVNMAHALKVAFTSEITNNLFALHELELSQQDGGDLSFLSADLADVMHHADQLIAEHASQTAHLERLYGIVTDLYIDRHKFLGLSMKHRIPQLLQLLADYNTASLIAFFRSSASGGDPAGETNQQSA